MSNDFDLTSVIFLSILIGGLAFAMTNSKKLINPILPELPNLSLKNRRMSGVRWRYMLPEARAKALQLIELAEDAGLDVMFYDGWRDPDETQKNISKGTSKVADKFSSPHTWGIAFDIVFMRFGQPFWPPANDKKWQMLGKIGKNLGLKWGGDFTSFFDGPHFELPGISVSQLKKQYANDYLAFLKFNNVDVA